MNLLMKDSRDGILYGVLDHEHYGTKLHRSLDDGSSWEEITTPQYPDLPEETVPSPDPDDVGKTYKPKLEKIWALAPGGTKQPDTIWCGTLPGGLFVTKDRGTTWELVRGLWDREERKQWMGVGAAYPALHSICVDPRDQNNIVIGASTGGAWHTFDGGESWSITGKGMFAEYMNPEMAWEPNVQDPHLIVQCESSPDVLWTQHHNGVFKSDTRGGTWDSVDNLTPSKFGFPVVIHPKDSDQVWLVPAEKDEMRIPVDGKVVVNRTMDGGQSWETIRNGLPQEDAYDMVLRHAFNISPDGEVLAFGSTTGSLWVSENQGDSWQSLSSHLPPVYCVILA